MTVSVKSGSKLIRCAPLAPSILDWPMGSVSLWVISESRNIPKTFRLEQNYPNPFNPRTTIRFGLPVAGHVSLKVYNVLGQEVLSLIEGFLQEGYRHVDLDMSSYPSGLYFYRLQTSAYTETKKLILMK